MKNSKRSGKQKTNEAKHTPTPWEISREENGITTIRGDVKNGRLFAVADALKREDAALIVKAVNSYGPMLDRIKQLHQSSCTKGAGFDTCGDCRLIALAEGGK